MRKSEKQRQVVVHLTVAMAEALAAVVDERLASSTDAWASAVGCDMLTANRQLTSAAAAITRISAAVSELTTSTDRIITPKEEP